MEDDNFHVTPEDGDTNVRVAVRCRPFNSREKAMPDMAKCINIKGEQVIITGPSGEEHSFAFDCVFDDRSTQPEVWENVGLPILEKAFSGYNGTIFAYGQTGSGKTWSMQGAEGDLEGVIPRMNKAVFERIASQKSTNPHLQFLVTASYFELYNEIIFDLLDPTDRKKRSKSGLEIKEHPVLGVYVKGLQEIVVDSPSKMQGLLDQGMNSRTVASTQMNAESSRSHSVFTIKVHQKDSEDESKNLFAKVNLVDLAGSERVKSTGATGAILKEGANINKSLSALGNVINALVECAKGKKGVFVPYRNSKLTRVLQESLGGNSITVMIAALSPALCNFEETLSTLKYANRAKAIKVKAIKNDESSQISRLNEEIRMLKEKLITQKTTVDTSLLEEKHQQQLRDLEEAMKSTWEEKARVSADHEKERIRLEREQQQVQQKLAQQREDNWRLLETKGDMELSITHLKDLLRVVEPEGGVDRIGAWAGDLRDIIKLESELSEQFTVIDVYQSSLLRDSESLLKEKKNNANIMGDKIAVGQWKQLRDKFQVIHSECNKWVNIRSKLISSIEQFLSRISSAQSQWQESQAENTSSLEISQVSRGFNLIQKQVQEKHQKFVKISSKIINVVSGFNNIADKMILILQTNKQRLESIDSNNNNNNNNNIVDDSDKDYNQERQKLVSDVINMTKELKTFFTSSGTLGNFVSNGLSGREKKDSETQTSENSNQLQESIIQVYENVTCSNRTTIKKAAIDSEESWIISTHSNTRSESDLPYIQISLPESQYLANLMIQGGLIPQGMQLMKSDSSATSNGLNYKKFTLPCNFGIDNCDGSIENTIPMLADIISWEALIKKNPPEKFLARPPVKFLFDLINYVVRTSNLPVYQTLDETNWDIVGSSKENKMLFIDKILSYVANSLKIPSPTTSAAIVSGAEGKLTNIFLQHLSIVGYCYKNNISIESILLPPPQISPRAIERLEKENLKLRETWIEKIRIGISLDGINYTNSSDIDTSLHGYNDIKKIELSRIFQDNILKNVKYIRIYAILWNGQITSLRFNLTSLKQADLINSINSNNENLTNEFQKLFYGLVLLRNSSNFLSLSLNHLNIIQELEVARKQEEVRKKMENLADEKLLLEQKLANEKLALSNEKEGLEEQLRIAVSKLKEAEELLAQEKSINIQLKNLHQEILSENQSLQHSLQQQMDENNSLQSQLLMLQANSERDNIIMEGYRKKIDEDNEKINQLSKEIDDYKNLQLQWTTEHDDFLNQIEILTEERDSARQNEEELYSVLKEKINDLERLQESYVDMTDRCNDYQDTMADMREEMESLKDMMLVESRQFISSQSNPVLRSRSISEPPKEVIAESTQTIENISNSLSSNSSPRYEYKSQDQNYNKPNSELSSSQISIHSQTQSQSNSQKSPRPQQQQQQQQQHRELSERASTSQVEDDNNYNDDNFEDDFEDDFES